MRKAFLMLAICMMISGAKWLCNTPLYEDAGGWCLWSGVKGEDLVDRYARALALVENLPGMDQAGIPGFDYMRKHGSQNFIAFVIKIPEDMSIYWSKDSRIALTYCTKKKDTLRAVSDEFFFMSVCPTCKPALLKNSDIAGYYSLPNNVVFCTPKGNPVVFGRFRFEREPAQLVSCTVSQVVARAQRK